MSEFEQECFDKIIDFEKQNQLLKSCLQSKEIEIGQLKSYIDELEHSIKQLKTQELLIIE